MTEKFFEIKLNPQEIMLNKNIIFKKLDPFNVAYVEDEKIYMEPFLKKNKNLLLNIIDHEKRHLPKSNSFFKDYKEDLFYSPISLKDTWFILKHKPFFWLSPFIFLWRNDKYVSFDSSRFVNFVVLIFLILFCILLNTRIF